MDPLYERILTKGSRENQQEASVLLVLIDEDIISTRSEVVVQAWKYIETSCSIRGGLPERFYWSACFSRAKALLGGLIDIIELRDPHVTSEFKSVFRLLHKSLSTYLRRGYKLADRMTERTRRKYANNIWTHLMNSVLLHASRENVINISALMTDYKQNVAECSRQGASQIKVDHKVDSLKKRFERLHDISMRQTLAEFDQIEKVEDAIFVPVWNSFSRLIGYCSRNADCCTNLGRDTITSVNDFMLVHTILCRPCAQLTNPLMANHLARLYQKAMLTWVIAICHGYFQNAARQLEATRSILTHEDLQAMFDILVTSYLHFKRSALSSIEHEGLRLLVDTSRNHLSISRAVISVYMICHGSTS